MLRASRYLGVPPWDLASQHSGWMNWALMSERAEVEARSAAQPKTPGADEVMNAD